MSDRRVVKDEIEIERPGARIEPPQPHNPYQPYLQRVGRNLLPGKGLRQRDRAAKSNLQLGMELFEDGWESGEQKLRR